MAPEPRAEKGRPYRPVLEALELLLAPGAVAELRALGRDGRVASGYFDDHAALAGAVEPLDAAGDCRGIYVTLNPVAPALLARRANRVEARLGRGDATTSDGDIASRRWLPIDVDPVRPSGVSSTADEHRAACETVGAIRDALAEQGWPAPVVADSGNGGHLLYRVDLPNDDESTALVKGVLAALDARFSTAAAKVDTANFNAARIWKCYGTVGRKGDSTQDRPHRRAGVVSRPFAPEVVPVALLRALAAPPGPPAAAAPPAPSRGTADLRAWLEGHGIAVAGEKPWQGGTLYTLAQCPFSDAHADGAYAVRFPSGAVHAGCKHDSCGGGKQRWQELRARLEPGYAPSETELDAGGAADEVLARGDPVRYFLDCFADDHVGDDTLAHCLGMSIASQTVRNGNGLHVYVTGESGKGKSSGMTAMLRQVPEEFRLAERMSNKALYYSDDIAPGTVFLLDDIALSEELLEVLKEATTRFGERIRMRVVNTERKIQHCTIPERCAWWLANVSALYDDQVLNRMLTCWVDDSEAQDAEVFRRKMAAQSRPPEEGVGDRFALRVCRELWRRLRAEGLVYVRIPFAPRIRMGSVRNRRNPEVLLDLVRSHALCFCRQRERGRLPDGGLVVTATEEDFRYAARLFADLHTAGGSLEAKFDRNEDLLLGLAARNGVEQFTIADVQRWTGWTYHKARRMLIGYTQKGTRYPGLLDKSPALSVLDRTTSEDDAEGRAATQRQFVFLFDGAVYRETRASGLVWLEREPDGCIDDERCTKDATPDVPINEGRPVRESENGGDSGACRNTSCIGPEKTEQETADPEATDERAASGSDATPSLKNEGDPPDRGSGNGAASAHVAPDVATPVASGNPEMQLCNSLDPRAFITLDGPAFEPCSICEKKPSFYREKWVKGMAERRVLCKRCYGAAVRRAQAAVEPLPRVIAPAAMKRVMASVGRCGLCGLEKAAWSGDGVRLCEACYQREIRRAVEQGKDVLVPMHGSGAADVRS